MIPLTTGFLSWCFHYTAAIHNGEVCGYNWGILTADKCWFSIMRITAALHLHYSAMRDQHTALQMRNPVRDRLNGKACECHYPALIGTPNTNPAYACCPFVTDFHQACTDILPMVFTV